jgi:hypothetical protein
VDWTPRSIFAKALLCIEAATELAAGCQLVDTYFQCCFVLTGGMCFAERVAAADAAAAKALAVRAHVPIDKDVLLLTAVLPELLFPV